MAIVKMSKLSVIGMISERQELLESLESLGIVEISSSTDRLQDEKWADLVEKDGDEEKVSAYDRDLTRILNALGVLEKHGGVKKALFEARRPMMRSDFDALASNEEQYSKEAQELIDLNDEYNQSTVLENQAVAQIQALTPWLSYDLPLELTETERTVIRTGIFPPVVDLANLTNMLEEKGCPNYIMEIGRDKQLCYASLVYFPEDDAKVQDVLRVVGFANPPYADTEGTVPELIKSYEKQIVDLAARKKEIVAQIEERASYKEDLEYYHDLVFLRKDKSKVRGNMLNTEQTFTFDGWIPAVMKQDVEEALEGYVCTYTFSEPTDEDKIPVVMSHRRFTEPMEFVTGLYSLPNAREVDPTSIFTLFYIVFFGMMFADVGYGLILFFATLFVIKHYKLYEGGAFQLMRVLNYCGVSSAIFGVLFGSYFGDLFQVIGREFLGKEIVIKPLWLDPVASSMTLLIISCGMGVVHLFVGMGIKAYQEIKAGDVLAAVNDVFVWYMIVLGVLMLLFGGTVAPWMPTVGKYMAIAGFVGAIVIPIFMNKGISKALGLWNIYSGLTGNLSDILSYSRLLGLGLASASIAQVINFLASLVGSKSIVGIILFILVELLGHTLNFAINALGSFVHSARLQYVEFFGKFFEGGGEEFKPFGKDTKYIRIVEEGK